LEPTGFASARLIYFQRCFENVRFEKLATPLVSPFAFFPRTSGITSLFEQPLFFGAIFMGLTLFLGCDWRDPNDSRHPMPFSQLRILEIVAPSLVHALAVVCLLWELSLVRTVPPFSTKPIAAPGFQSGQEKRPDSWHLKLRPSLFPGLSAGVVSCSGPPGCLPPILPNFTFFPALFVLRSQLDRFFFFCF